MALTLATVACCAVVLIAVVVDGSPVTRRLETTTSSLPVVVTSDWDETDDFDMDDGDDDWLGDTVPVSPSSLPFQSNFNDADDYDDYDDLTSNRRPSNDDDVEVQDAEELDEDEEGDKVDSGEQSNRRGSAEFLFMPATDKRLMLQDDEGDQSGLIKVRHTGKSQYPEVQSNSLDQDDEDEEDDIPSKDDGQFEFTLGEDEEEKSDDGKDDFVLEDTRSSKDETDDENIPKPVTRNVDEIDDDDDDDDDDDLVFESPEEDSQVIYGDPVFLY